jgi:hypothetical protein
MPWSDRLTETGSSSGIGDIRLGLTKQLCSPSAIGFPPSWHLAHPGFGQWRTSTGAVNRSPSTGYGIDALQFGRPGCGDGLGKLHPSQSIAAAVRNALVKMVDHPSYVVSSLAWWLGRAWTSSQNTTASQGSE